MREKILMYLEKNSRVELSELAIVLGEDEETVKAEIQDMEKEGVICGYHTMINWEKTESDKVIGLIEVSVTPQRGRGFDTIAERIYNYPEVQAVYLISGGYDLLVTVEGRSLREVSSFVFDKLATLDTVTGTKTNFVLRKYKDHGTVMVEKKKDERIQVMP